MRVGEIRGDDRYRRGGDGLGDDRYVGEDCGREEWRDQWRWGNVR